MQLKKNVKVPQAYAEEIAYLVEEHPEAMYQLGKVFYNKGINIGAFVCGVTLIASSVTGVIYDNIKYKFSK